MPQIAPVMAKGYQKMIWQDRSYQAKHEPHNRFFADILVAQPLTTTGFRFHKQKSALVGISKREYDITGYVASRMVRSKSLKNILDYTQPVMTTLTFIEGKYTARVTTGYDEGFYRHFWAPEYRDITGCIL